MFEFILFLLIDKSFKGIVVISEFFILKLKMVLKLLK